MYFPLSKGKHIASSPYLHFYSSLSQRGFHRTSTSICFTDSCPGVLEREAELQTAFAIRVEQAYQPDFHHTSIYQTRTLFC